MNQKRGRRTDLFLQTHLSLQDRCPKGKQEQPAGEIEGEEIAVCGHTFWELRRLGPWKGTQERRRVQEGFVTPVFPSRCRQKEEKSIYKQVVNAKPWATYFCCALAKGHQIEKKPMALVRASHGVALKYSVTLKRTGSQLPAANSVASEKQDGNPGLGSGCLFLTPHRWGAMGALCPCAESISYLLLSRV